MRAAAARGRERVPVGGLTAYLHPDPSPTLSVALPDALPDGEAPPAGGWDAAVAALTEALAARGRWPRLELVAERRPALAGALERAGFRCVSADPLMALEPAGLRAPADPEGLEPLHDEALVPHLRAFLRAQARAYADLPAGAPLAEDAGLAWLPSLAAGLEGGWLRATALREDGRVVAGATLSLGGPAAELAGVFTVPERRRRGLAARACGRLLVRWAEAAAAGEIAWLSAAPGAQGVYRRLGFRTVGTQRNYELTPPG